MRILDEEMDRAVRRVTLYLTRPEAVELLNSLEAVIAGPPDEHEHVSSDDYSKQVTVCIYDSSIYATSTRGRGA